MIRAAPSPLTVGCIGCLVETRGKPLIKHTRPDRRVLLPPPTSRRHAWWSGGKFESKKKRARSFERALNSR